MEKRKFICLQKEEGKHYKKKKKSLEVRREGRGQELVRWYQQRMQRQQMTAITERVALKRHAD